jgi:uncharacterized membrane protein YhaH (DUF805 family)
MKANSTKPKSKRGEFRWIYWDEQSEFPEIGDGFYYLFYLMFMLNSIIHLHQAHLKGLNFEFIFTIFCVGIFALVWALLTLVRLRFLRRSLFWALLILPQPLLFFYQIHLWGWLICVSVIFATTLILYLIKPRSISVGQTASGEQPTA